MARKDPLKLVGGSDSAVNGYAGPVGEPVFNRETGRLHMQNGALGGIPMATLADARKQDPTTNGNLTAKGTTADDALILADDVCQIGVGAPNTGVRLSKDKTGKIQHVINRTGNQIRVYPPAGGTIYGYNQDEPMILKSDQMASFLCISSVQFRAL